MAIRILRSFATRCLPIAAAAAILGGPAAALAQTCADHGIPVNGYPKWQERAMLTLTNACRIAPVPYRNAYLPGATGILQPGSYPAVAPVQWQLGLSQSARAHSIDLATTIGCPFAHNSCNGTSTFARIASYYPNWSAMAENIAAGYADPLAAINALLLDNVGGIPAPDGSPNDGHRRNIMSASYTQLGNGHATGPNPYTRYWTQDFGRPQGTTTICSPIPSGSHIIQSGQVVFLANYYDAANAAPQSAQVVINGAPSAMTVHLGAAARGTYRLTSPVGASCRSYHFEFRDASGALRRYPARGELRTFGEGACSEDYTSAPAQPACIADFDGSGSATIDDIFAFLNAWFAGDPRANADGVGGLTIDDIFVFLNRWFAGC